MNRYLFWGTLTAAIALFAWQMLSNTLLGWHEATLSTFAEPDIVVAAMNASAPESGMYYHERGIVAAVSMVPGVTDKSALMSGMLVRQIALNLVACFLLALVVARRRPGPLQAALLCGGVALAAGVVLELSNWNWYGFPLAYSLVNVLDAAINVALAGAILGWFVQRMRPVDAAASESTPSAVAA